MFKAKHRKLMSATKRSSLQIFNQCNKEVICSMELCFIYFHGYFNIYLNLVLYYGIISTRTKLSRPDICNLCNIVAYILMKSLRNTLVKVSSKYGQYFLRLARTNKQTSFMKVIPPYFHPQGYKYQKIVENVYFLF